MKKETKNRILLFLIILTILVFTIIKIWEFYTPLCRMVVYCKTDNWTYDSGYINFKECQHIPYAAYLDDHRQYNCDVYALYIKIENKEWFWGYLEP